MTYRGIANRLLRYIGITSLASAENANSVNTRGLDDQDIPDVVACIQGALDEIVLLSPSNIAERQVGVALRPPTTITLSATQYSTACAVTGWLSWMAGCTVRVTGQEQDNRFISATELLRPYMGATGSTSATVYADCVPVSSAYESVIAPIRLPNLPSLTLAGSREEFDCWSFGRFDRPRQTQDSPDTFIVENKEVGVPVIAFADFEALGTAAAQLYLRLNPMPGQAYPLTFTGKLAPPTVTEANIWNESAPDTDPAVTVYLPKASSTVLAFALKRWTAHPSFSSEGQQLQEIDRQYQAAKQILRARRPQSGRTRAIYAE